MGEHDDFFDGLEKSINGANKGQPEQVAFLRWEERGLLGCHIKSKFDSGCFHAKKTMDDASRMLQCDECQAYLDPYDVLYRLVQNMQNMQYQRRELRDEISKLSEKKEVLKKELRSLDGKINRRKNNLPPS